MDTASAKLVTTSKKALPPLPQLPPAEVLVVPLSHIPVRSEGCRVEPNGDPDEYSSLLAKGGAIGSHDSHKESSQTCWESCKEHKECGAWFFCDTRDGCFDHHGRGIPYKGCEIRRFEVIRTLGHPPVNWTLSSFAAGYMHSIVPEEQVGQYTLNRLGDKVMRKPKQNVIITTSLWPKPCNKEGGDHVNRLSILNKIDYARVHGYEFHLSTHIVDKSLGKLYSKIGLLRQLLSEATRDRAEWILWIDADTIIMDLPFQIPFHLYEGRSFIAWGYEDYLLAGNQRHGLNTGTLLLRNDKDFSDRFWKDVAYVSRINQRLPRGNPDTAEGRIKMELEDQVQISGSFEDLCDQNVMVYLLRVKAKEYMPKVWLEDGRYCMSCWYKDISTYQAHTPFVNHYAACQMCTATNPMKYEGGEKAVEWSKHCHNSFMENYRFTNHSLAVILGCERTMRQWGPPLGLPIAPNFNCKGKRGQPTCPPLPPLEGAKSPYISVRV